MKLPPQALAQHGYILLDELAHKALMPFLNTYLKKKTKPVFWYNAANVLALAVLLFVFFRHYNTPGFALPKAVSCCSFGIAAVLLLIPLHEGIHALAYTGLGAPHTSFAANFKKFYFLAVADQFVVNRREFTIVALAPFATISTLLLVPLPFVSPYYQCAISMALLVHTGCCAGDFALLSYFSFHNSKTIVTYDDKAKQVSYFFEQLNT